MKTNFYHDLLQFINRSTMEEDFEGLYRQFYSFLAQEDQSCCLVVFSRTLAFDGGNGNKEQYLRRIWSSPNPDQGVSQYFEGLMGEIKDEDFPQKNWKYIESKFGGLYFFRWGQSSDQVCWSILKFRGSLVAEENLAELVFTYLKNSFERITGLKKRDQLGLLAYIDDVTGLYNQRKMKEDIVKFSERYEKFKTTFAILFIDIDHFKSVNDGHGHLVGTNILNEMAVVIKGVLRDGDLVYRYGGDEFVVILPNIGHSSAMQVGERLLRVISRTKFNSHNKHINLTVSIGVAHYPQDARNQRDILEMADQVMYQAKTGGRGRVCSASELISGQNKKGEAE